MYHRTVKRIHFIGIGGIGVSALAQWYQSQGWQVSGSDAARSIITDSLKKKGLKVTIGKVGELPKRISLVIYSAAVPRDHPERREARLLGILERSYAEALGALTKKYRTIAISGAHGKSTTTAMVGIMLVEAGFDPTVIVGTRVKEFGKSNFREGRSRWLVLEADEFHASFLNYHPYAAICTNVDREHLDFYKTFSRVKNAFRIFFSHVEPKGILVLNGDDKFLSRVKFSDRKIFQFSLGGKRAATIQKLLKVPGQHNVSNALAADLLGKALGISERIRNKALAKFRGTWRRFEFKGFMKVKRVYPVRDPMPKASAGALRRLISNGARVYDDYGHHPAEIRATLAGAREKFPKSRIWCVFQPHHQERLRILFQDFTRSFNQADRVIIVETYKVKGREKGQSYKGKDAVTLARRINGSDYALGAKAAQKILFPQVKKRDIIIVMGAGDITELAGRLVNNSF